MLRLLLLVWTLLPLAPWAGAPQTVALDVQNRTCSFCPVTVKRALEKVPGVTEAKVDFAHKTATATFDPDRTNPATLAKATIKAGHPAAKHHGAMP